MNTQTFDTIVIGSSAYFAITTLNKAGQKVAVIDERPMAAPALCEGVSPRNISSPMPMPRLWP
jgi:hypothetical protein